VYFAENIQQDKDVDEAYYDDDGNEDPKDTQDINEDKYDQIDEDVIEDTRQDDNPNQHLQEDAVKGKKESKEENEGEGTAVKSNKKLICKEAS
jgi:hypothetical protein